MRKVNGRGNLGSIIWLLSIIRFISFNLIFYIKQNSIVFLLAYVVHLVDNESEWAHSIHLFLNWTYLVPLPDFRLFTAGLLTMKGKGQASLSSPPDLISSARPWSSATALACRRARRFLSSIFFFRTKERITPTFSSLCYEKSNPNFLADLSCMR